MDFGMIARLLGRETAERGLRYAEQNRVTEVKWDDDRLVLRSLVKGTEAKPYRAMAKFNARAGGPLEYNFGHCSCPVTINCKHVAAMLFDTSDYYEAGYNGMPAELHAQSSPASADPAPWERRPEAARREAARHEAAQPESAQPEKAISWRQALDSLLAPSTATTVPLALQFELVERPGNRWRRSSEPVPRWRLGVRPARKGDAGRWVVGGVSWRELNYYGGSANYRPDHFRWFTEFYALFKSQASVYYPNEQRLFLDDFANPKLWQMLAEAAEIGVELISTKSRGSVTVHEPTAPTFDIRRGAELTVSPTVMMAGAPVAPDRLGFIGGTAHGIYTWQPDNAAQIEVAPLSNPISSDVMSLLLTGAALRVPPDDEPDFATRYYPVLSQRLDVISSDDSYQAPDVVLPVLLLEAAYVDSRKLELNWSWIYSGDVKKSLRPRPGEFRMTDFEQSVLGSLPIPSEKLVPEQTLTGTHAIDFTRDVLDKLIDLEHVRVEITGERPDYHPAESAPLVHVEQKTEAEDGDWLDLTVTVSIDGEIVAFASLFEALSARRHNFILPSGKYFPLNVPELARLRELIDEAATLEDQPPDGMRISKFQAGLWEEFEKLGIIEQQTSVWRDSLKQLAGMTDMPEAAVPDGLDATLRPYQLEGFRWLAMLWRYRLGGVLADDMGLGKTLQALALIQHAKSTSAEARPFLVAAPTSVVSGWASEAEKFTPGLRVVAIGETSTKRGSSLADLIRGADVVVTSYTLFRLDFDEYRAEDWAGLILDEAQAAKNHQARLYQCARRLDTRFKIAITGTPMENNLMELWSIFSIVAPGLLPGNKDFAHYYRRAIEKNGDAERLARLRRRIRPFIMRRRKQQVVTDLPEKQEQVIELDLDTAHRRLYQTHLQRERKKVLGLIADMDKNRVAIFRSLTLLRQLSLAPVLIDDDHAGVPSAKIDALLEQLGDLAAEGHRALVFSQFTGFLGLIKSRLEAEGIAYSYLSGSTRNRKTVIDGFKNGDNPVFLISLKAGGVGLNLTEADYCFIMDPWWNPATEAQAVDRTHRIGQTKNVMVYRLVASDTIEDKVMELKERKAKLFAGVLDDGEFLSNKLTADDVRGLFEG
ncbi:DEAD/DEAH box helicase [Spelaeicoccus albus]|uniref:SNF2 family DNA or RNA helicase n=1 Tax=Spelaeicoccus albus TaxID=1280376 RepID=A0A7Z0AAJ5_9MICO|nr:DEAD/DEAH box helicase [Spelaeicoccus albus]NYI67322.1 SNF2 family DNA or RNA helicase [Spelaeicoccus albus]